MDGKTQGGIFALGLSIVIPTYREAGNMSALIARLAATMGTQPHPWEVIITDDRSDDDTVREATAAGEGLPVRVCVREEGPRELAANVLSGMRHAHYDRIVVMDADLSHRPEDIPRLVGALESGADIAIGSRYAQEAEIDARWSARRRWGSRIATLAARALWPCSDPLSGFFALRRTAMPARRVLDPSGYKIALELAVRGAMRTAEVPIRFEARHAGASKMDAREVVRFARHLARLYRARWPKPARAMLFCLVGASGLTVDVVVFVALGALGLDHRLARALSFWPAVT